MTRRKTFKELTIKDNFYHSQIDMDIVTHLKICVWNSRGFGWRNVIC